MTSLEFPSEPDGWETFLAGLDAHLREARTLLGALTDGTARDTATVLELWNDSDIALSRASAPAHLLAEVHPDAGIRAAAEARAQAAEDLATDRGLDADLHAVLAATDPEGLDRVTARLRAHVLRDFRRSGVDLPEETRERLRTLTRRCTELGLAFSRTIREDTRRIRVRPERLEGLPGDFREAHRADQDGLVTLTTEYPDLLPVRAYARDGGLRRELVTAHLQIGWPTNAATLHELLTLRAERARLLGYPDWPTYDAEVKMIGSGAAIRQFLDRLDALTADAADDEVSTLLARYRHDDPSAAAVTVADSLYYGRVVREEQHAVDAQEVRSYLSYPRVLAGVLDAAATLLGITFTAVSVATWHESVVSFDVADAADGRALGRVHLDMHPRPGKFNHAAQFPLVRGIAGRALPEGVLVCNLPTGLMEHDDLTTLFHEFGHLMHEILGGHQRWAMFSGVATEWDFVEAPSMLLEDWAWDPEVLGGFAIDDAGRPIPADLVARMRAADRFGRATWTRRQLAFAALSYGLHAELPDDPDAYAARIDARLSPFAPLPGTHQVTGFGHLDGYGSGYYTYLWSLVIARDLSTAFGPGLLDPAAGHRYRKAILEPGGSADAADLTQALLGRPTSFDAFEAWLGHR